MCGVKRERERDRRLDTRPSFVRESREGLGPRLVLCVCVCVCVCVCCVGMTDITPEDTGHIHTAYFDIPLMSN